MYYIVVFVCNLIFVSTVFLDIYTRMLTFTACLKKHTCMNMIYISSCRAETRNDDIDNLLFLGPCFFCRIRIPTLVLK